MRLLSEAVCAVFALSVISVMIAGEPDRYVDEGARGGVHFQFHNSPTASKYLIETMGGGVAVIDYDADGWPDLFFVNGAALKDPQRDGDVPDKSAPEYWNRLYHNNWDGTFTDVTAQSGLQGSGYGMGVAVGDYDNDGFPDLLITNYGGAILYHNNQNGSFSGATLKGTTGWTTGAGFLDYDNDGCLDLFVARYLDWTFASGGIYCGSNQPGGRAYCHPDEFKPVSHYLFHGNCKGEFTDASETSHIASSKGKGLGVAFGDYNGDGFLDIFVANDFYQQQLFRNNGNGTFTEVAMAAGAGYNEDGRIFSGMGAVFADLDDDGYPDLLATALPYEYYALFHNQHDGSFAYDSARTGLAQLTRPYGGWGTGVLDFDNVGHEGLFFANSHVMDNIEVSQPHLHYLQPPLLLKYLDGKFVDASGSLSQCAWAARGAAFGDLDNDGAMDIVVSDYQATAHVLHNRNANRNNHWITLNLRGTVSNRDAIGANIRLTSNAGKVQYAMVSTAGSYLSANDKRVHFGIGAETSIREIQVRWPSGITQVIQQPKADQTLKIVESAPDSGTSFNQGLALAKDGKTEDAARAFRVAIRSKPDSLEAHFALGVLLARQGKDRYGEALQEFLQVLRLNPGDIDAHINLSNLLEQESDFAASANEMQKAVALSPGRADLQLILGQKQFRAGRYADAIASFRAALVSKRVAAEAHFGAGLAMRALRKMDEAATEFRAVLELNPRHAGAHFELGRLLTGAEDLPGAASHLQQAVAFDPALAEAHLELGKVLRKMGKTAQAESAFQDALRAKPDLSPALYELATIAKERGDTQRSHAYFAQIRELDRNRSDTNRANALNGEGIQLMNQGKLADALTAFRKALESDPQFATAAYNMGVVLAHQGAQSEAMEAFRNAIRIRPGFQAAHFGLALLLKMRGDPKAEEEFKTAEMLKAVGGASDQELAR